MYSLIRNLRIRHKFAVVSALTLPLFVVPTGLVVHDRVAAVAAARAESDGLGDAEGVLRLVQATQQHRLASAQALATLAPLLKDDPAATRSLADLRSRWEALATGSGAWATDDYARHTALVHDELVLLRSVADAARLSIDPEPATAGEQGRGFAVVASEVRALATRSAAAAQEIRTLITDSAGKIEAGASLATDAGAAMHDIVARVQRVNTFMGEISTASHQQARGVGEVSGAVGQLDAVTQQNAALVEESAAAAESLNQQAVRLVELVRRFRETPEPARA
jgi:hypothetical protein